MTQASVLAASYKFKVLSLDQQGDQFLVMMDLVKGAGDPQPRFGEIEAMIVRNAKLRFTLTVLAVYWRLNEEAAAGNAGLHSQTVPGAAAEPFKPATSHHEPIQAEEVMAFKQALLGASAQGRSTEAQQGVKTHSVLRPFSQPNDFEDTEILESASAPVLSNSQYGDLN